MASSQYRRKPGTSDWRRSSIVLNSVCEGFNAVIETIKKNARGFRRFESLRDRILFRLGQLDLRTPAAFHLAHLQPFEPTKLTEEP